MFIKFESDAIGSAGGTETTVECTSYSVKVTGSEKRIRVDDQILEYIISGGIGHWQRAYIMNNDGDTIEKVFATSTKRAEGVS